MRVVNSGNLFLLIKDEEVIGRASLLMGGNGNLLLSYSIDKTHREQGHAKNLLKEVLKRDTRRPILAYTSNDNLASMKVLRGLGFYEFQDFSFILR